MNEDFKEEESWCQGADDSFLIGDVNGDHHDSWICHHEDGTVCTRYNTVIFGGISFLVEHIFE